MFHVSLHDVGAGKTHTMEGSQEDPGINYRAMKELFRCISYRTPTLESGHTVNPVLAFIYDLQVLSGFSSIAYSTCRSRPSSHGSVGVMLRSVSLSAGRLKRSGQMPNMLLA